MVSTQFWHLSVQALGNTGISHQNSKVVTIKPRRASLSEIFQRYKLDKGLRANLNKLSGLAFNNSQVFIDLTWLGILHQNTTEGLLQQKLHSYSQVKVDCKASQYEINELDEKHSCAGWMKKLLKPLTAPRWENYSLCEINDKKDENTSICS